jgi:hypothetical protein
VDAHQALVSVDLEKRTEAARGRHRCRAPTHGAHSLAHRVRRDPVFNVLWPDPEPGAKSRRLELPTIDSSVDGLPAQAALACHVLWRKKSIHVTAP